jgi:hypothetical protein
MLVVTMLIIKKQAVNATFYDEQRQVAKPTWAFLPTNKHAAINPQQKTLPQRQPRNYGLRHFEVV